MKVALVQFRAGLDPYENLHRICGFVEKAAKQGAKFILLPEVFLGRGLSAVLQDEPWQEALERLGKWASQKGIHILAGSVREKRTRRQEKPYNTSFLINDRGEIQAAYRKIHLFNARVDGMVFQEDRFFKPGRRYAWTDVRGYRLGLSICYDLRFPRMYGHYARVGADILCVPAAFTRITGQAHWEVLLRARAIENHCYVLAPNQVGTDGQSVPCYGHSMIVDPWGKILARASATQEEILFGVLRKQPLNTARTCLGGIL